MSPKELLYVEDSLSHEKFFVQQCREMAAKLHDTELVNLVRQLEQKHTQIFNNMVKLL